MPGAVPELDAEKSLVAQPPTADNLPTKIEPPNSVSDDAASSKVVEEKPEKEKEKKEGVKDYFVRGNQSISANID